MISSNRKIATSCDSGIQLCTWDSDTILSATGSKIIAINV